MKFIYPNKPIRIYDVAGFFSRINPKDWIGQAKINGCRAVIHCSESGKITVYSRQGTPLTKVKVDVSWLAGLPIPKPWVLDSEYAPDGSFWAWDIPVMGGVELWRGIVYEDRWEKLKEILPVPFLGIKSYIRTTPSFDPQEKPKETFPEGILEGYVFKNRSARDLWDISGTRGVPSQVKYILRR